MEEKLNRSKTFTPEVESIFELSIQGMLILSPDGTIIQFNKAARDLFGTEVDLQGIPLKQLFVLKPAVDLKKILEDLKRQKIKTDEQLLLMGTSQQNAFWANIHFSVIKRNQQNSEVFLCQILNVSDLKKAEDEVFYKNNLLNVLINSIPDNVFIKDIESRFLLANKSVSQLMGAGSSSELIGKSDFDFYPRKLAQKYRNDELKVIRTGEASINIIEQVIDKEHNRHWYSTSKLPLKNSKGEIVGIMGIGRNITNLVKEKKALKKAKQAAEKADQLKTSFLANLSHEVRTPLNGILGFSQFLKESYGDDPKTQKYIEYIIRNGKRLLHLISDIVDISKIDCDQLKLTPKKFHLADLMHKLKHTLHVMLDEADKKSIIAIIDPDPPDETIILVHDDQRIEQIMHNLLSNAVKFTDKGQIRFGYTRQEDRLRFFVQDTGIGIEEKNIPIIFNRFTQLDNSLARQYEGAGLGLSLVSGLIHLMGSELNVISDLGQGTEFAFTLPVNC